MASTPEPNYANLYAAIAANGVSDSRSLFPGTHVKLYSVVEGKVRLRGQGMFVHSDGEFIVLAREEGTYEEQGGVILLGTKPELADDESPEVTHRLEGLRVVLADPIDAWLDRQARGH